MDTQNRDTSTYNDSDSMFTNECTGMSAESMRGLSEVTCPYDTYVSYTTDADSSPDRLTNQHVFTSTCNSKSDVFDRNIHAMANNHEFVPTYGNLSGVLDRNMNSLANNHELTSTCGRLSDEFDKDMVASNGDYSLSNVFDKALVVSNGDDRAVDDGTPKIKRRRRREKNPNPIPNVPVLPPCRICNEKSSGFHYGANTCEACKGFFRRTLKKTEIDFQCKCSKEEFEAWKRGPYKNNCSACRYKRCLAVGMSRTAIKIGRYTLDRITENIKEVKSLEANNDLDQTVCSTTKFDNSFQKHPIARSMSSSSDGMSISDISSSFASPQSLASSESSYLGSKRPDLTNMEIEAIVKELTEVHKSTILTDPDMVDTPREIVSQRHRKYLADFTLKEATFGNLNPLSREEYKDVFMATGIDVDGRQHALEEAFDFFTKKVTQAVKYAKAIPGFRDLRKNDQINLLRSSRQEHILLANYRSAAQNASPELQMWTTPWGKDIHTKELGKILPMDIVNNRLRFLRSLTDLGLTIEEGALLRGIAITFSDRCELEEPEKVEEIQYKFITCLEHLLDQRDDSGRKIFYQIFDLLVKLRNISDGENKVTKELMFGLCASSASSYQLLKEFFD